MLPSQVEASVAKSPSVTIDPNGNRASLAYRKADGTNIAGTTYTFDRLNRLRELNTTGPLGTIQRYTYTLGPAGNRTKIEEHDATVRDYTYDDLYRLTSETVSGSFNYAKVFTYDPVGNRLRQVTTGFGAGDITYTYDTRDRLLTEGPQAYSWDDNGNLISKAAEATYFWDFENRLIKVQKVDGTVVEHLYDPDGNRVQTKTTSGGATTITNYLVDTSAALSHIVAETDQDNNVVAYYVRADDLLAVMRPDGGGGFVSRFYHADGLGSIRRLTDDAGNITDGYTYSAFGELLAHTGSDPQPYTFAGEPYDPNIGFYYNRARWLDPRVGRFASPDSFAGSIFEPGSLHKYLYVENDPVNTTDPTGRISLVQLQVVAYNLAVTLALAVPRFLGFLEVFTVVISLALIGIEHLPEDYVNPNHGTNNPVAPYEVDDYDDLLRRAQFNKQTDVFQQHHAPQKAIALQVIRGYDPKTGVAMALPIEEHREVSIAQLREPLPRGVRPVDLVMRDILHIRTNTRAALSDLRNLAGRINARYPAVFALIRRGR
jgi:RHS repeat-associated protein